MTKYPGGVATGLLIDLLTLKINNPIDRIEQLYDWRITAASNLGRIFLGSALSLLTSFLVAQITDGPIKIDWQLRSIGAAFILSCLAGLTYLYKAKCLCDEYPIALVSFSALRKLLP